MAVEPQNPAPSSSPTADRARAAEPGLTRSLVGLEPTTPEAELRALADVTASLDGATTWDRYGEHGPVGALEARLAEVLDLRHDRSVGEQCELETVQQPRPVGLVAQQVRQPGGRDPA